MYEDRKGEAGEVKKRGRKKIDTRGRDLVHIRVAVDRNVWSAFVAIATHEKTLAEWVGIAIEDYVAKRYETERRKPVIEQENIKPTANDLPPEVRSLLTERDLIVLNYPIKKDPQRVETRNSRVQIHSSVSTEMSDLERRFRDGEITREEWIRLDMANKNRGKLPEGQDPSN
jgi:hypothetical protein